LGEIHRFFFKDKYLVLDVESDALHEFDPPARRALELLEQGVEPAKTRRLLTGEFGEAAAAKAPAEIALLQKEGMLWSGGRQAPESAAPRVKALCLFATDNCNLSCRYCFANKERPAAAHGRGAMSAAVGKAAVDFLLLAAGPRRHCEIDYFGGEPLLNWPVIKAVTAYARERSAALSKEIAFTITTNGLLLTPEIAGFLEEESFAAVLSLDGRPAVHDLMRPLAGGGGSYPKALPRLQSYTGRRPRGGYYIRGTYTRHNLDFCRDVEHLYNLGFRNISMEPVVAPPGADYALRETDLPRLEREYENLVEFYLACRAAGDPFVFYHFAIDLERGPCLSKRLSGCGAGREYLAVTPDGSLYPCHQLAGLPELKMGSVLEPEKFQAAPPAGFIPAGPLQGRCRSCWARYHCGGGCRAASYLNGEPGEPYPLECALQRKRLECALYLHAVQNG
jgi:uncharacterized protein